LGRIWTLEELRVLEYSGGPCYGLHGIAGRARPLPDGFLQCVNKQRKDDLATAIWIIVDRWKVLIRGQFISDFCGVAFRSLRGPTRNLRRSTGERAYCAEPCCAYCAWVGFETV
jgi:hypothetical protein